MKDLFGEIDEEGMYQLAINQPLEYKIEQAIKLIQCYQNQALQLSEDGYYVCFSGGKDSIVMAKLFDMAGVKYRLHYSNVTIDPPELVRFLKREYPQAEWHSIGIPLPYYMAQMSCGPPTRLNRWCCKLYKEQGGAGKFRAIGVRAEESARRKGLWRQIVPHRVDKLPIMSPILYWTDSDIWQFITDNNMPYCDLYDQGFTRLGCVGCPMGGYKKVAQEFKRWPGYERLWKRGFQRFWDKYHGTLRKDGKDRVWLNNIPTVDDLWNWWVSGKAYEGEGADCQGYLW